MPLRINSSNTSSIQFLLTKSLINRKVKTSDLRQCVKDISNNPRATLNKKDMANLRHLSYILENQNSNALNKKRHILSNIAMIIASDRLDPFQATTLNKGYNTQSTVKCSDNDPEYATVQKRIATSGQDHNAKRIVKQFDNAPEYATVQKRTATPGQDHHAKRTVKQFDSVPEYATVQKRTATPGQNHHVKSIVKHFDSIPEYATVQKRAATPDQDHNVKSIVKHFDSVPEYATVQKQHSIYTSAEIQGSLENAISELDQGLERCNNTNEKRTYIELISIGEDIYNMMGKLDDKKTMSPAEIMKAKRMTNKCLRKIYSIDTADMPKTPAADTIQSMALMARRRLNVQATLTYP